MKKVVFRAAIFLLLLITGYSCTTKKAGVNTDPALLKIIDNSFEQSAKQYKFLRSITPKDRFPKTYEDGKSATSPARNWTSGLYPGTLVYLYEYTKDDALLNESKE